MDIPSFWTDYLAATTWSSSQIIPSDPTHWLNVTVWTDSIWHPSELTNYALASTWTPMGRRWRQLQPTGWVELGSPEQKQAGGGWKDLIGFGPGYPEFPGDPGPGKMYYGLSLENGHLGEYDNFEEANEIRIGLTRNFFQAPPIMVTDYSAMQTEIDRGRLPWMSTKVPGDNWAEVANGNQDAWIDEIAIELGTLTGGPVWFTIHHEPRNDGDPAIFRAMWERMVPRMKAAADLSNVAFTPILNDFERQGQMQPEIWLPNTDLDFVSFDAYNQWWKYETGQGPGVDGGLQSYRKWLTPENVIGEIARVIQGWGYRAANAEHGVHYAWIDSPTFPIPRDSCEWITGTYDLALELNMVALSYFASGINSPRGTWEFDVHDRPPDFTTKYPDAAQWNRKNFFLANARRNSTYILPRWQ